jgi:hypothetical protein
MAGLRAGLTGRKGCRAVFPGLHPGLVELALQAGIARGAWGCRGTFHVMRVTASKVTTRRVAAYLGFGVLCVSGLRAIPVLVHSRCCCICGLYGQLDQPGMQCQVGRSPGSVALQGQLSARTCRATGGTRGILRVEAMVDWCAPGVRVGCRGIRSGVGANASPGTGISCNRRARCRGGAKSWPYRPESQGGRGGVAGLSMSCV